MTRSPCFPRNESVTTPHAYILAGGQSRRFGSDKARALLGGEPLIARLADRIAPVVESVTVVADIEDKYADLNLHTIADRQPGLGPIGGLATALDHLVTYHRGDWLLLSSCDLVEPDVELIRRLRAAAATDRKAIAFKHDRWEPLFALYHRSIALDIGAAIADGQLAMQQLLDHVQATKLALPAGQMKIVQVNTPGELSHLCQPGNGAS